MSKPPKSLAKMAGSSGAKLSESNKAMIKDMGMGLFKKTSKLIEAKFDTYQSSEALKRAEANVKLAGIRAREIDAKKEKEVRNKKELQDRLASANASRQALKLAAKTTPRNA